MLHSQVEVNSVDFGRTAADYALHRAGFPESFITRRWGYGVAAPGHDVLDLGTGTGTLARQLAARGCVVTGLDPSAPLLAEAARLATEDGVPARWVAGRAEATGLPDGAFDLVTAGQCWHWFDGPAAAAEVWRVLRPGGAVVVAHFDWIPLPGNVPARTERLIQAFNPGWAMGGGNGLHGAWLPTLGAQGFRQVETFSYDVDVPYSPEGWRGRIRASAGVGASLPPERVEAFDAALSEVLAGGFSGRLVVPHRVWAVVARRPSA